MGTSALAETRAESMKYLILVDKHRACTASPSLSLKAVQHREEYAADAAAATNMIADFNEGPCLFCGVLHGQAAEFA